MSIVVIGSVFVDIKGYPYHTYIPGGRNHGRVETIHGGVGRNIAEDVANLELRPVFLSLVDSSGIADDVLRKLKNHKINTDYIMRSDSGMGTWLAVFNECGDVVASISKRPVLIPLADVLAAKGDEIFSRADSVLFEMDLEKEVLKEIYRLAGKYHVPLYAAVSNMSIAATRRDLLKATDCIVCNQGEAGILFSENYDDKSPEEMCEILKSRTARAEIPRMIVTMGDQGSVYADRTGTSGICPAGKVTVIDTTGAGDAFFAGAAAALTFGKTLKQACEIGTRLAASVIETTESVCPRFLPSELGLDADA